MMEMASIASGYAEAMEVHQLRYVLAIADSGSFTEAAARLGISQSGVSSQILKLERELGVTLFERGRGTRVTEAGQRVIDRIRAAVASIDEVTAAAGDLTGLLRGTVRVGAVAGLAWPPFLEALATVHADHPGLDLSLREGVSADLQAEVLAGRLDVAVVSWPDQPLAGLRAWTAVLEHLQVLVPSGHRWADRARIRPAELVSEEVVCTSPGTGNRAGYERLMRSAGLPAAVQWEVTAPPMVRAMVARGFGVGVLAGSIADPPDELVHLPLASAMTTSRLGVVWRDRPPSAPGVVAMLDSLRRHLGVAPE